ncbi:unnamed protein product [Danaus chrysippus]|uniref:(African queen) hypothetical protein n=1 Tax=Danaus chrysippus TaxID=151541 RepID=A0A8J2VUF8_9NEOP|nr:unnamed protein product [Danaus chrysippus]
MFRFLILFILSTSVAQSNDGNNKRSIQEYFSAPTPATSSDVLSNKRDTPNASPNCTRDDGTPGVCVLYYQCNTDDGQVITDGSTIIDIRGKDEACSHYLQVCCVLNKVPEKPIILEEKLPEIPANSKKCGWNNPALHIFQSRDTAGLDDGIYANYGDFPWMIAVIRNRNETEEWSKNDYLGGGFLVHPSVVVTAAHKVEQYRPSQIKCRAGEWDTQTTYELFEHQEREVSNKIIHPNYFRASVYNDIAVLFLKSPFSLDGSPNINVACVGTSLPPPGTKCFSMGWGANFRKKNEYAVILKKVRLPLIDAERCETLLRKTRLGPFFRLDKSLTCAGGEDGVDTCRGDGGSSLVCPVQVAGESTRYEVFGMVAYGIGCGSKDVPSVYVNIPYLKPWLDAIIAKLLMGISGDALHEVTRNTSEQKKELWEALNVFAESIMKRKETAEREREVDPAATQARRRRPGGRRRRYAGRIP